VSDTINTYTGEDSESPEQQAELLRVAEGGKPAPAPSAADGRPDWLPEKFKSAEDMADAYAELERKLGSADDQDEEYEDEQLDEDFDPNEFSPPEVAEMLAEQNLDFEAFAQEFYQNGGLSDRAYDVLEQNGIPRGVVDQYIDGQTAIMDNMRQTAFQQVGGEGEYANMINWAANNLSQGQIEAFNANLNTHDFDQAMFAIQGLAALYRSEVGRMPNMIQGQTNAPSAGAYQSLAEMTRDMADPKYASDPAYRQMVASKLKNSSIL
jgi:hypothetical protein